MKNMLDGRVVLITGSSRGIGEACARLAINYGAKVILHGRTDSDDLKRLAQELKANFISCDVADKTAVERAVKDVAGKLGKIDVLINCAGILNNKPFFDTDDQNYLEHFKINFLGTVHFCQAVAPAMKKTGYGRIVNISSLRGHAERANNESVAYSASKAAVINFTVALAKECAPNILVNCVSPGPTLTQMSKHWSKSLKQKYQTGLLKRAARPEEIAEVILFLASERNTFMTGQTIIVDGGYSISGK